MQISVPRKKKPQKNNNKNAEKDISSSDIIDMGI